MYNFYEILYKNIYKPEVLLKEYCQGYYIQNNTENSIENNVILRIKFKINCIYITK